MASKKAPSPDELIEQVRQKPHRGGGKCLTCKHPKVKQINAYLRELHEKSVASGTYVSPKRIIDLALKPMFGYDLNFRSLRNHMEKCLGFERQR